MVSHSKKVLGVSRDTIERAEAAGAALPEAFSALMLATKKRALADIEPFRDVLANARKIDAYRVPPDRQVRMYGFGGLGFLIQGIGVFVATGSPINVLLGLAVSLYAARLWHQQGEKVQLAAARTVQSELESGVPVREQVKQELLESSGWNKAVAENRSVAHAVTIEATLNTYDQGMWHEVDAPSPLMAMFPLVEPRNSEHEHVVQESVVEVVLYRARLDVPDTSSLSLGDIPRDAEGRRDLLRTVGRIVAARRTAPELYPEPGEGFHEYRNGLRDYQLAVGSAEREASAGRAGAMRSIGASFTP